MTIQPYSREFFAPRPSRAVLFLRTFLPWQLVRFVWINFKMIAMIGKAHSHRALPPPALPTGSDPREQGTPRIPHGGGALARAAAAPAA